MDVTNVERAGLRRLEAVRGIVRRWRALVPRDAEGKAATTLVACSGGADSTALALALHAAKAPIVIGHVVHDLRPPVDAHADRDAVQALAGRLGVAFIEAEARRDGAGNAEGVARRARYAALARMAVETGAGCVATAHHADDQLETVVMALLRGAGPEGLAGVAASRPLAEGVRLIRPMLGATRADAVGICETAGVCWRVDATNFDTARLRAGLRHGALAELAALRPGAATRAARSAELLRDAAWLVRDRVREVFGEDHCWPRPLLGAERAIVVGAGLRAAALRLTGGEGADRLTASRLDPVVQSVRDASTEPREFAWPCGLRVRVDVREVRIDRLR